MVNLTEIQVLRAEGKDWEDTSLGCYVTADDDLLEIITPVGSSHVENSLKVPSSAILRLIVKSMGTNDKYLGSVSIPISVLPAKGYVWLPLLDNLHKDFLHSINEAPPLPRILVGVTQATQESTQAGIKLQLEHALLVKESLESKLAASYQQIELLQHQLSEGQYEVDKLKQESCIRIAEAKEKQRELLAILTAKDESMQTLQEEVMRLSKKHAIAETQMTYMEQSIFDNDLKTGAIDLLERENSSLRSQVHQLKHAFDTLQVAYEQLGGQIAVIVHPCEHLQNTKLLEQNSALSRTLQERTEALTVLKTHSQALLNELKQKHALELKSLQIAHEASVQQLLNEHKAMHEQYENQLKSVREESSLSRSLIQRHNRSPSNMAEDVDFLLIQRGLDTKFIKSHGTFYLYKDSLVEILAVKDHIYVKSGRSYLVLEDFLRKLSDSSKKHIPAEAPSKSSDSKKSKRFQLSTQSSQRKVRAAEFTPLKAKNRIEFPDSKRPFK